MSEIINQLISIADIQPHPKNYNSHSLAQIKGLQASHDRFAQYRSVVVAQLPTGGYVQVAGHGVVEALKSKQITEVRADVLIGYADEDIEGILSADNLHAQRSESNQSMLQQLLRSQAQSGRNLAALGLPKLEADKLLATLLAESKTAFLMPVVQPPAWVGQLTEHPTERTLPEQRANVGEIAAGSDEWVTVPFTVTQADRSFIHKVLREAKTWYKVDTEAEALVKLLQQSPFTTEV